MRIIDKIEFTSNILKKTEKDKIITLDYLKSLQNQISNRKKIVKVLKKQIDNINKNLIIMQSDYDSLVLKKQNIRNNYSQIMRKSLVKSISKNDFLFILSSSDWENFLNRKRSIKQFNSYTKKRLLEINSQEKEIEELVKKMTKDKIEVEKYISEQNIQLSELKKESKKKDLILKKLAKNRKKLLYSLKKQKKQREKLNKNIEDIILNNLTGGNNSIVNKDESAIESNSFADMKANFDWPVVDGYISSHFGKHRHPTIKGIYTFNNGVDIRTYPNSIVKSIYDGKIVGLMHISGFNWMMIIKHGDYYSVYSKLENVNVSKGDLIKKGQTIGNIGANGQFHFEIWKEKTKLNPENWFKQISSK